MANEKKMLRRLIRNSKGIFGLIVLGVVVCCALFSPWISPHSPYTQSLSERFIPPFWQEGGTTKHLLGTDHLGRDVLSRIIYGARISVIVAFSAIFIAGSIGVMLGLIGGYFSRYAGAIIMRLVDAFLALPYVLISIAVVAALGGGLFNLILVLALIRWAMYARITGVTVLQMKGKEFIEGARARGLSSLRIISRQLLPNVIPPALVLGTLDIALTIIMESTLSFLGLGVQPPTPTWGLICSEGREYLTIAWWLTTFSGLAIIFTVLGANQLGDWLRDVLDPRLKT